MYNNKLNQEVGNNAIITRAHVDNIIGGAFDLRERYHNDTAPNKFSLYLEIFTRIRAGLPDEFYKGNDFFKECSYLSLPESQDEWLPLLNKVLEKAKEINYLFSLAYKNEKRFFEGMNGNIKNIDSMCMSSAIRDYYFASRMGINFFEGMIKRVSKES